jgi:hypothetical protein
MPPRPLLDRAASRAWVRIMTSALLAAGGLALPGVAQADGGACATASMSAASQPACWHPFSASSPFNAELPANPALAPDSAAVQAHMATYGWSLNDSGASRFTLSGDGSRPVYFASPSDPVVIVHCTEEDGPGTCRGTNGVEVDGAQINLPAGAAASSNWDGHMTVIEAATGAEYDFWHASVSGSTLTAGAGSETSLSGDGTGSQGDAAYFALTAGLLRPSELASGHIDHALVITVPCTDATGASVGYTYPARFGWGESCDRFGESDTTAPMLGQRFQLAMTDAQIAASGAPAWEQTIMTALAHYGAYIEDTDGTSDHYEGMDIITQDPASWTSLGQPNQWAGVISQLGGSNGALTSSVPIPVSRLQLVSTCITQGTCPGATGPSPADPSAPPVTTTTPSAAAPAGSPSTGAPSTAAPGAKPPTGTSSPAAADPARTAGPARYGSARHGRRARSRALARRSRRLATAERRFRGAWRHVRRSARARRSRRGR